MGSQSFPFPCTPQMCTAKAQLQVCLIVLVLKWTAWTVNYATAAEVTTPPHPIMHQVFYVAKFIVLTLHRLCVSFNTVKVGSCDLKL